MFRSLAPYIAYSLAEKYVKRDVSSKFQLLRARQKMKPAERMLLHRQEIVDMLEYARATVPYYRSLFQTCPFEPGKILKDCRYLSDIPVLTKEIIVERGPELFADSFREAFKHHRKTGGSTGISANIYYGDADLDWTAAVNLLTGDMINRGMYQREVHLAAEFISKPVQTKEWLYGYVKRLALNRENVFVGSLDDQSLLRICSQISKFSCNTLQAHPSTVYAMADYWLRMGNKGKLFKKFVSTGETLTSKQAATIVEAFGCQIFNRYGSAEFGVTAHSRQDPFELEWMEFVSHPEIGETSGDELVLTGLLNRCMPLIRYRTGDCALLFEKNGLYFAAGTTGRVHDTIRIGEKKFPSHYIQDLLDALDAYVEFQIHVRAPDNKIEKICIVPSAAQPEIKSIEDYLFRHLGERIPLEFIATSELIRVGWRDKFRRVIEVRG